MEQCTPTHEQARRMRAMYNDGKLTSEAIEAIMLEQKPNQKERIVLHGERCSNLFPKNLPLSKREDYVIAAMQFYGRYLEQRDRNRGSENER
jgi:ParB family chromosome partitioning protein